MKKRKRGIQIKIILTNRWLYTLIAIGILAIIGVGVWAYGTYTPSSFGHTAGELNVDINGDGTVDKTLQQAIDAGDFGGGAHCTVSGKTITCPDGTSLTDTTLTKSKAFYKVTNSYCEKPTEGYFTLSSVCYTFWCGYHKYYSCTGACNVPDSPAQCPNQFLGYFVS